MYDLDSDFEPDDGLFTGNFIQDDDRRKGHASLPDVRESGKRTGVNVSAVRIKNEKLIASNWFHFWKFQFAWRFSSNQIQHF